MRKKGKCVHFNGIGNDCCKAGVNYKELTGNIAGYGAAIPCLGPDFATHKEKVACDKFLEPTEAEIAEDKVWLEERMRKQMAIIPVIADMKGRYTIPGKGRQKFRSGSERFKCPACYTGELHVAISGYNGHTQGRCTTQGCVSWIE